MGVLAAGLAVATLAAASPRCADAADDAPLPPPVRRVLRKGEQVPGAPVGPSANAPQSHVPATTATAAALPQPRVDAEDGPPTSARRLPGSIRPTSVERTATSFEMATLRPLVQRLTSSDFLDRMRATREIVELGEPALPALAAAGQLLVPGPGGLAMHATRGAIEAILEDVPAERLGTWMASPSPEVRRAAVAECARRRAIGSVPDLLVRLGDPTPCVRAAAVAGLRQATGQWFGFDPDGAPAARAHAAARWQRWWNLHAQAPGDGTADIRR
ncbi:MAG: hypothetical protein AB7T63_06425 [Planctomycetota bacterium]